MQDYKGLWQAVLGELEVSVTRAQFMTWFKQTGIISNEDGHIVVAVPNVITKNWLQDKYHANIKSALTKINHNTKTVEYKVGDIKQAAVALSSRPTQSGQQSVPQMIDALQPTAHPGQPRTVINKFDSPKAAGHTLNSRYTFDTFVVGSSNEFAHAACQAVAKNPGTKYNPLFLYGGTGLGKTHLMQAVGNQILRLDPSKRIEYVTTESFTNEFISGIMKKKAGAFAEKYRAVDVLIIDDIQFLVRAEKTQDEFFHTFNALHQANKQIIISSDKPPQALMGLEERLRSRCEAGITVDIQPPDLETRVAILQSKATAQGAVVSLDVLDHIARHAQSNIRELEGALTKLLAWCEVRGLAPDMTLVTQIMANEAAAKPKLRPPTSRVVIEKGASYFDLQPSDILGPKRDKGIVLPRQVVMYIMRHDLDMSFPKIAAAIGGRDHTTAMHSVAKIEKVLEVDEHLRQDIQAIRERLNLVR